MFDIFVYICGIITLCLGVITFISFLGIIFTNSCLQFYGESKNSEGIAKWNVRFNFIKNWAWQFSIYLFAFTSLCAALLVAM